MTSFRKTALAGGIFYLLTFIGSIPAGLLVGPAKSFGYVTGPGADTQIAIAAVLELVNVVACIGCAVALFSVVRRVHEGLAVGYLATRVFEAATITIGVVSILALVTLRQQGAASGSAAELAPVGDALTAVRNWVMTIGPNVAGFNALMLGTALYRARLVPRALPALGIIGAPILTAYVVATILGAPVAGTVFEAAAVFPFFAWELVLGLWLTFKGFNESSPIAAAYRAERTESTPSVTASKVAIAAEAGAA